jgi:hypothetical protein
VSSLSATACQSLQRVCCIRVTAVGHLLVVADITTWTWCMRSGAMQVAMAYRLSANSQKHPSANLQAYIASRTWSANTGGDCTIQHHLP